MDQQELMKKIMEIQRNPNLTDAEKAAQRQQLMAGKWVAQAAGDAQAGGSGATDANGKGKAAANETTDNNVLDDDTLKCAICFDLCVRPITAPCQHNFCLKCFQDLVAKSKKKACPSCRCEFSNKFAENPRINTALAVAIRAFKAGARPTAGKTFIRLGNDDRPDEAFTTERAQRAGRANAASGRIMVTVPNDHFGPIPPEADPRGQGVRVGEWWRDRLDCRQWGAHFPHVAGIAGQSNVGAQSVVLSGGYEDDRDEGEWFLYTGSGGRDLSGNKRTSKVQSFDQTFEAMNKALKLSCTKGLPVRVVRSYKEKRSAYAPPGETPVRYDGVYRIVKCWRKKGKQGLLMCRYLFVRADNEPAPWSSEESGDRPGLEKNLPAAALEEIRHADKKVVFSMSEEPWWDWDEEKKEWGWARPPPVSHKAGGGSAGGAGNGRKKLTDHEKALREMTCGICKDVLVQPVSTPCGHSFCKPCLDKKFGGMAFEVDAGAATGRSLRIRKVAMPCPTTGCKADLADFIRTAQVNRDMEALIARLQKQVQSDQGEQRLLSLEDHDGGTQQEQEEEEQQQQQQEEEGEGGGGGVNDGAGPSGEGSGAATTTRAVELSSTSPDGGDAGIVSPEPLRMQPATTAPALASRNGQLAAALCADFPEYDASLVEALVEQEEGDVGAVRVALCRMRNHLAADERKRAKEAKRTASVAAAAAGNGTDVTNADASEGTKSPRGMSGCTPSKKKRNMGEGGGGSVATEQKRPKSGK